MDEKNAKKFQNHSENHLKTLANLKTITLETKLKHTRNGKNVGMQHFPAGNVSSNQTMVGQILVFKNKSNAEWIKFLITIN